MVEMFCNNGLGRITSDGANTYTYDGNGNLRRRLGDGKVTHSGGSSNVRQEGFCPDEGDRLRRRTT